MIKRFISLFLLLTFIVSMSIFSASAMGATMPYSLGGISFYSMDNQKLTSLKPNQSVMVRVDATKNDATTQDGILIVTITDQNNKLVKMSFAGSHLYPSLASYISCNITLPNKLDGYSVNAYIWSGISSAVALSEKSTMLLSSYNGSLPEPTINPASIVKVDGYVSGSKYSGSVVSSIDKDEVIFNVDYEYITKEGQTVKARPTSADYNLTFTQGILKVNGTNAKSLVEYYCTAFIDIESMKIISIAPVADKNEVLTVKSSDIKYDGCTIYNIYGTYVPWNFSYFTDVTTGANDMVLVAANAKYYYNGSAVFNCRPFSSTYTDTFTLVKNALTGGTGYKLDGTITLLNNNDDGCYDVIFINENTDYVVDEVIPTTNKIYSKIINTKSLIFDTQNADYDFNFIKDGQPASFADIKSDDVLSVCGHINGNHEMEFGTVYITSKSFQGLVSEANFDEQKVVINNTIYYYTSWMSVNQITYLCAGAENVFFVNAYGKICAAEKLPPGNKNLAYVTKIAPSSGILNTVQLRALTTAGEWKTFDLANNVMLNANVMNPYPTAIDVTTITDWSTYYPNAKKDSGGITLIYTTVYYELNSAGQINKLDFIPDDISYSDYSVFFGKDFSANSTGYSATVKKIASSLYVNDSTVIFNVSVPTITQTGSYYTGCLEDNINVYKTNVLSDLTAYQGMAYNLNDTCEAALLMITTPIVLATPTPTAISTSTPTPTPVVVDNSKIAYVTKIATTTSISSTVQLRALNTAGEWKTFDLADIVYINPYAPSPTASSGGSSSPPASSGGSVSSWGSSGGGTTVSYPSSTRVSVYDVTDWSIYYPNAKKASYETTLIYSAVSFDVNSDGKINMLNFKPDTIDKQGTSTFFYKDFTTNTVPYATNTQKLASGLYINDATIIFNVDGTAITQNGNYYTGLEEDKISANKADVLMDSIIYKGIAYNLNSNNEAAVIVGSGITGVINYSNNFMIVDTIGVAMNADADMVYKLYGFEKGARVSLSTTSNVLVLKVNNASPNTDGTDSNVSASTTDIKKGSVILYAKNIKGEVNKLLILFNCRDVAGTTQVARPTSIISNVTLFNHATGSDYNTYILGYAYDRSILRYTFATNPTTLPSDMDVYSTTASPNVYSFDGYYNSNAGIVRVTDMSDINTDRQIDSYTDGDFVFAHVDDSGRMCDIVIIKRK